MGKGRKKGNSFAARKREQKLGPKPDRRSEPYVEIVKDNLLFEKFYKAQNICPTEEEFETFLAAIKGFRDEAKALRNIIENDIFQEYTTGFAEINGVKVDEVEKPKCLTWYPDHLAWQLNLTRKNIRSSEHLFKLHNFLISETNAGAISRQEAVSMIPPVVLDVKPEDKVLDMCAAPGSKTAQLIEALHSGKEKIPSGFVVANDVDNNRCYMLVHQAKRMNSPCFLVTNYDSSCYPNVLETQADGTTANLKFDKVLCDVPCSGDGTMRKNPDIWGKWTPAQGNNLHGVQYRIAKRGAELLKVGGRLVYSTCSMNPIENEAVLQRLISDSEGMTSWLLASKEVDMYKSFDEVPEKLHTVIRPNMFPLPEEEIKKIGLDKCIRILPHLQNTGSFFVAAIQKKAKLPWEKHEDEKRILSVSTDSEQPPAKKKRRIYGYKEDPYVFFEENDPVWEEIQKYYDLDASFNPLCLLTRCSNEKKKNIYFCSDKVKDFVKLNEGTIKIINTGVKTFARCDNKNMQCRFRLAQEGLPSSNPFIGDQRRLEITKEDLVILLQCTDPTKPPSYRELNEVTQEKWLALAPGSCVLKYVDELFCLYVVGWRGSSSLRAYVDQNDTIHILRLLGADISKFEKNKFILKNEGIKVEENISEDVKEG
uniref:tRNA (cytosine(34)-C(5))-methyltransferase n=1 Tax=Megaselia scalaris TaxID=36166 RepID=T1GLW9_MEGSC